MNPCDRLAVQTAETQVSPSAQDLPQAPQLAASLLVFDSQPSDWAWLQSAKPALQAVRKQPPPEQPAEPCANAQLLPQAPQLLGSNEVLVQSPPQTVSLPEQFARQTPPMQDWPAPQTLPQAPQLAASALKFAQ